MQNVLLYAPHKSGTMFLNRLLTNISAASGVPYYSINSENFPDDPVLIKDNSAFHGKSGIFGPFRRLVVPPDISSYKIIVHLRDPRDVLTSFFFSHCYSHSRKEGGWNPSDETRQQWIDDGIDKYVTGKRLTWVKDRYAEFTEILHEQPDVTLVKYEEMVTDFSSWLSKFLEPFPAVNKEILRLGLFNKFNSEFNVKTEDIYQNRRQVKPGDHKKKLKPETIQFLNIELKDILDKFGYTANGQIRDSSANEQFVNEKRSQNTSSQFSRLEQSAAAAKTTLEDNHLNPDQLAEALEKLLAVKDTKTMQTVFQQLPPDSFNNNKISSIFLRYLFASGDNQKAVYFAEKLKLGKVHASDTELAPIIEQVLKPAPSKDQLPKPNLIDYEFDLDDSHYSMKLLLKCPSCGAVHLRKIGWGVMILRVNHCPKCLKPALISPEFIAETMHKYHTDDGGEGIRQIDRELYNLVSNWHLEESYPEEGFLNGSNLAEPMMLPTLRSLIKGMYLEKYVHSGEKQ